MFVRLGIVLILFGSSLSADVIKVINESDFDLYTRLYYFDKTASAVSQVKLLPSKTASFFERPVFKFLPQRKLVFSLNAADLKQNLTSSELHILPHTGIGEERGFSFYLDLDEGTFKGYSSLEWNLLKPVQDYASGLFDKIQNLAWGPLRRSYTSSPLATRSAHVRQSTELSLQEREYLKHRLSRVKKTIEKKMGFKVHTSEIPRIGFCLSGGGYRAMLGSIGSLQAADETGTLPMITSISAVSGSTLFLGPWISSQLSLAEFRKKITERVGQDFLGIKLYIPNLINTLFLRAAFNQPITSINIVAWLLALNLLEGLPDGPFGITLEEQIKNIYDGELPLPIYNAITTKLPYQWVEFTPFEVGGNYFGGYIPAGSFGSPFLQGKMRSFTPTYDLSFILAICVSALGARMAEAIQVIKRRIPLKPVRDALELASQELEIGKYRVSVAEVFNWTWGMLGLPRSQQKILRLIDAGIAYNIGLEPLLRRKTDIIVIFDFSESVTVGDDLRKAEKELREKGYKVPPIDYTDIAHKPYSIFKDPSDPTVPIFIYIPQIKQPDFSDFDPRECFSTWCGSFSFTYPPEKANLIMDLAKKSMEDATPALINEIAQWLAVKRKRKIPRLSGLQTAFQRTAKESTKP